MKNKIFSNIETAIEAIRLQVMAEQKQLFIRAAYWNNKTRCEFHIVENVTNTDILVASLKFNPIQQGKKIINNSKIIKNENFFDQYERTLCFINFN